MSKNRTLLAALLIAAVAANIYIFLSKSSRQGKNRILSALGEIDNTDPRHALLKKWYEADVVELDSPKIQSVVLAAKEKPSCFEGPAELKKLSGNELPDGLYESLAETIARLVQAYANNNPTEILAFMRSQGQEVSPVMRKKAIKHYIDRKPNFSGEESGIDVGEAWCFYWTDWNYNPHWSRIIPSETSLQLYQATISAKKTLDTKATIASSRHDIWRNQIGIGRHFKPARGYSYDNFFAENENLLIGDARIVIEHDEQMYGQRSPYYIRMWLNPESEKWEPIGMSRCEIDLTRNDIVKIAF